MLQALEWKKHFFFFTWLTKLLFYWFGVFIVNINSLQLCSLWWHFMVEWNSSSPTLTTYFPIDHDELSLSKNFGKLDTVYDHPKACSYLISLVLFNFLWLRPPPVIYKQQLSIATCWYIPYKQKNWTRLEPETWADSFRNLSSWVIINNAQIIW